MRADLPANPLVTELLNWLRHDALPLWDRHGVDRDSGGYFEELEYPNSLGIEASGAVRRGRVVARQIFVFETGHRMGWRSLHSDPVAHGAHYLLTNLQRPDGLFHSALEARSKRAHPHFSLYEHAFYLFALAHIDAPAGDPLLAAATAERCLREMRRVYGKPNGGFEESVPPSLPLKANPHMHLLEAALAWMEKGDQPAREEWGQLAEELIDLCLTRFIDPANGALHEYFDAQWRRASGPAGRLVEPGHQFEWAWLLLRWATFSRCSDASRTQCRRAARRLMDIGEGFGVDSGRGVVVNELWNDMSVKDNSAKIWPQTERLKAWCAMLEMADSEAEVAVAREKIAAAARSLRAYLTNEPAGLWHEVLSADGTFAAQPTKASSLYHIVCAIDVLRRTTLFL